MWRLSLAQRGRTSTAWLVVTRRGSAKPASALLPAVAGEGPFDSRSGRVRATPKSTVLTSTSSYFSWRWLIALLTNASLLPSGEVTSPSPPHGRAGGAQAAGVRSG